MDGTAALNLYIFSRMFQTCNKPLSPAKMVIWHTVSTNSLIWLRVKAHAEWYPVTIVLLVFYWSLHPPPVSCCGKAASVLRPYVQKAATKTSAGPWGQSMAMGTASGETRLKNEDIVNLSIYLYIYIHAQRLGFAQALQRRGFPFPNKYWCNFTKFLWEKQQRY